MTVLFLNDIAIIFSNLIKKPLNNGIEGGIQFYFLTGKVLNKKLIKQMFDFN